jgi:glucosylceramidase
MQVWSTSEGTDERVTPQPDLPASQASQDTVASDILYDPTVTYQTMEGFGGAMTESSAAILDSLKANNPSVYEEVMDSYFSKDKGLGYEFLRVPMGSCDYTPYNSWSYDDVSRGSDDYDLSGFSIANDVERRIPYMLDAQDRAGEQLKILASPWSAPAWMKTNGAMICGLNSALHGCELKNDTNIFESYADYFSQFIAAYEEQGLNIWGVTVQNEPQENILTYEGMVFTPETERDFVKNYLSPTLLADHPEVNILLLDHNKGKVEEWADVILSDEVIQNSCPNVYGMGIHWYDGDHFDSLAYVHGAHPAFKIFATESTVKRDPAHNLDGGKWKNGEQYGHDMIGDFNNWVTGFVDWNLALDQHGGPLHINVVPLDHFGADSMTICNLEPDGDAGVYCVKQVFYYYVAHFSKFVKPGSKRIDWSKGEAVSDDVETTAFVTPEGDEVVVIVMNKGKSDEIVGIVDSASGERAELVVPAHSIHTVTYPSTTEPKQQPAGVIIDKDSKKEGFAFYSKPDKEDDQPEDFYTQWDWSAITTVATWHPDDKTFVDYAHSQGAKVVKGCGADVDQLGDPDYRSSWIDEHISDAIGWGTDGVNIDIESNNLNRKSKEGYTLLVKEAAERFHAEIEGSQVSVDFPGYPNYELRNYDYEGIGKVADVVVIMGYDMFLWDDYECMIKGSKCSMCNAPLKSVEFGVQEYLKLVDKEKLVLGLPWYGIMYQRSFNEGNLDLRAVLNTEDAQGVEREWVGGDEQCWKIKVKGVAGRDDKDKVNSIYFDDSESLKTKFDLVNKYGLGGATMWNAGSLEYGDGVGSDETKKIWQLYTDVLTMPAA